MIRLTKRQSRDEQTVVGIEGRLDRETVRDLEVFVVSLSGPAVFDLSGLAAADESGRTALIALRNAGHRLTGGSLYIKQLLEEVRP